MTGKGDLERPGQPPGGPYKSWNTCSACGFRGIFEFVLWAGEPVDDPDSLGTMFDTTCPACGERESVLVTTEEYHEMVLLSKQSGS